ncbi:MAG: bifunctional diaminohydroxyphosphoribosylaminopyrimidine deaminase/5-amino-6-(5-phosphoribosylamino)uracil reductase RibD [Planctomycetota bacterium]
MNHGMNLDPLLRRAIELAKAGRGHVEPNPMVGCVLVSPGGEIIGEGIHARFGEPHAEPTALADCARRGNDPAGATAVVTLEPCCHIAKKTPPCVPTLISAGIAHVAIGALDPNPAVNGEGIRQLRDAGVEVTFLDSPAARQLLAPFIAGTVRKRPYVTAKVAVSADGLIAGPAGEPVRITGPESDKVVMRLRSRCDAIAVGGRTLRNDDPALTVRGIDTPPRTPLRIVLTRSGDVPPRAKLLSDGGPETLLHQGDFGALLADLHGRGHTHLLLETGPRLLDALRRHVDRLWTFTSPRTLGEGIPIDLPDWPGHETRLGIDTLRESFNPDSPVYFAAEPSADFPGGSPES